jgi:hypothetical protein
VHLRHNNDHAAVRVTQCVRTQSHDVARPQMVFTVVRMRHPRSCTRYVPQCVRGPSHDPRTSSLRRGRESLIT